VRDCCHRDSERFPKITGFVFPSFGGDLGEARKQASKKIIIVLHVGEKYVNLVKIKVVCYN